MYPTAATVAADSEDEWRWLETMALGFDGSRSAVTVRRRRHLVEVIAALGGDGLAVHWSTPTDIEAVC